MAKKKNRIFEIRRKRGLTQEDLSKLLGVSCKTLSNLEAGRHDAELISKAAKLCEFLKCDWKDLCESLTQENGVMDESQPKFRFKGEKIADLRRKRGFITQQELGDRLDVRKGTIAAWENEKHNADSWRKLIRLCEVLDCSFAELLPVESTPVPPSSEPIDPSEESKVTKKELEETNEIAKQRDT